MNNMAFTKKNHFPQGFLLHIYFRTPFLHILYFMHCHHHRNQSKYEV